MKKLRVAVVGLGRWGSSVAQQLNEAGALAAVCDLDPGRAAGFEVPVFDDYLSLLGSGLANAVALGTPRGTHYALGLGALGAGLDVWLRGPIAESSEAAQALVDGASEAERVLHLDPHPAVSALAEMELGERRWVEARAVDFGPFEEPQTRLVSVLEQVQAVLGERPTLVRAEGAGLRQATAPDVTVAHLRFPSGARASVLVSRLHPRGGAHLTVIGAEGAAEVAGETLTVSRHQIEWLDGSPSARPSERDRIPLTADGPDLSGFLDAVRRRAPNLRAQASAQAWLTAEAVGRSLDEDRWVEPAARPAQISSSPPSSAEAEAFLHPTVAVSGPVTVGAGTRVWHFSKLLGPLTIGRGCTLGQNVVVERHVSIGDNVKIQNNVSVYSGVVLEDDVFCGPSMVFTNVGTPRSHFPRRGQYQETRVERGASIGANATVVCGNRLGAYCFVGAGAVVTRPVPPYALVFGNPARVRGWACYCGERLPLSVDAEGMEQGVCPHCERRYEREGLVVKPHEVAQ